MVFTMVFTMVNPPKNHPQLGFLSEAKPISRQQVEQRLERLEAGNGGRRLKIPGEWRIE